MIVPSDLTAAETVKYFADGGPHPEEPRYRQLRFGESALIVVPCCQQATEDDAAEGND